MFGLQNFRGSCWVNSCLQALFRIPDVQQRYSSNLFENRIEKELCTIWNSKGKEGLKDFFDNIRTESLPAGQDIGDSHELFQYLCDKLPYLDKLCRFRIADSIQCDSCKNKALKEDSVIEFSISAEKDGVSVSSCIADTVLPQKIPEWKCDHCGKLGCTKQQLIGTFPDVMVFHLVNTENAVEYSSVLVMNKHKYQLLSVVCYNGSHWWTYGRNIFQNSDWFTLNDDHVENHGYKQFPLSPKMRFLIYYRLNE